MDMMEIRGSAMAAGEDVPKPFKVKMLSLGGMLIESDHLHELGSKLHLEIILPDNVRLALTGRPTSSFPSEDGPAGHYDIGIKITALSSQDRTKLKEFIRWLYLKDAGFTA